MTAKIPDWQKRIKEQAKPKYAKRFYQSVEVTDEAGGFLIRLDGRVLKTPMKAKLQIPTRKLADAIASEWQDQIEFINPHKMLLTKFTNTSIDRVVPRRSEIIAEITEYAGNDLLCYRVESPQELAREQDQAYRPVLDWLHKTHGASLQVTNAITHAQQLPEDLQKIEAVLEEKSAYDLTAIHIMTSLTGSAVLAIAVEAGFITADAAFTAANIEEDWNISHWGQDNEAKMLRQDRQQQFRAVARFLDLSR